MRFTEIRDSMQTFTGASTPDYQLAYMTAETKDVLNGLNNKFVEFLTKDILESEPSLNIKQWLGSPYYSSSNDSARDCLELCLHVKHIYGRKIKAWTDNALKCYDNFLLKYVQNDRGEKIQKSPIGIKETDVYKHLMQMGEVEKEIGQYFGGIYRIRNTFHHIQIEEKEGVRIPRKTSIFQLNQSRDLIIYCFKQSLIGISKLVGGDEMVG